MCRGRQDAVRSGVLNNGPSFAFATPLRNPNAAVGFLKRVPHFYPPSTPVELQIGLFAAAQADGGPPAGLSTAIRIEPTVLST